MKRLKMFQPALLLTAICLVVTLLLAATNELTKAPIAKQEEEAALAQKQEIFPDGKSFTNIILTDEQIASMVKQDIDVKEISTASDADGKALGYVFIAASRGYAGDVVTAAGIDTEGHIIMVSAKAADDTPGLGKRVEEKAFLGQFTGMDTTTRTSVNGDSGLQHIDGVSGATISSKAASSAINKVIGAYAYLQEEGVIS